jgi:hypothetical protein
MCNTSADGADLDKRDPSAVAGAVRPSSCTPVVAGACVSSACVSVGMGGTMCESESEGCIIDVSRDPVGILGWSSTLSCCLCKSSSLQTVYANIDI